MAAMNGHTEVVKLLLASNADVNATRIRGTTVLMMAALGGYMESVKLLLESKANVNAEVHSGGQDYAALSIATRMGHTEVIKLLKEHGAND